MQMARRVSTRPPPAGDTSGNLTVSGGGARVNHYRYAWACESLPLSYRGVSSLTPEAHKALRFRRKLTAGRQSAIGLASRRGTALRRSTIHPMYAKPPDPTRGAAEGQLALATLNA